ncbi:MAG: diguanylate cyclase domain-containing protein, partial [Thiobacillus sp.]
GMRALLMPAIVEWDATLVVASVFLGMLFGAVAMNRIARPVTRFCKYGGALAMVLAIASMHFTAMGAMTVYPLAGAEAAAQSVPDSTIAAAVIVTFALVLITGGSAYMIDLHAANEASAKYRHMALHDPLTGLPNRSHLAKRLADMLAHNRDDTARIALLAIDLDRFKDVNDAHGHMAGDAVLQALAQRLGGIVQSGEFLARVGGDEFVAIKHDIFTRNEAVRFAERLRRSI